MTTAKVIGSLSERRDIAIRYWAHRRPQISGVWIFIAFFFAGPGNDRFNLLNRLNFSSHDRQPSPNGFFAQRRFSSQDLDLQSLIIKRVWATLQTGGMREGCFVWGLKRHRIPAAMGGAQEVGGNAHGGHAVAEGTTVASTHWIMQRKFI